MDLAHRRASPGRRRGAASRRGASRTRDHRRRRQRARGHGGDGGGDRRRLSAHEPPRRRRLLARARAVRPGARAAWRPGARAPTRGASSIATTRRIPPRGPLAALTVPGAVAGWLLALEAAQAHGGRLPLGELLAPAIRHAGAGYSVTREPGAAHDGEARRAARRAGLCRRLSSSKASRRKPASYSSRPRSPRRSTISAHAGLDDFYRGDVGREIAADLERLGSPLTRADLEGCRATLGRAAVGRARCRHRSQHAAADAGPRLAADPGAVRAAARHRGRELRSCPRHDRGDQAGVARARPRPSPIPTGWRIRPNAISTPSSSTSRSRAIDRRKAAPWPAPAGEGRHRLDGRRRRVRARRLLHPVALLGVRLGRRAAAHRRADAEPRRELLARSRRAQRARARTAAVPHPQSGAGRARATDASWPTAPWAATASRRRRRRCSPAT